MRPLSQEDLKDVSAKGSKPTKFSKQARASGKRMRGNGYNQAAPHTTGYPGVSASYANLQPQDVQQVFQPPPRNRNVRANQGYEEETKHIMGGGFQKNKPPLGGRHKENMNGRDYA